MYCNVSCIISFYILSFIEITEYIHTDRGNQNEPKVYVCVSVCLWTFLDARPDRTRGPIFMKFDTLTKRLIRYKLLRSIIGFVDFVTSQSRFLVL